MMSMQPFQRMTIQEVAETIDLPLENWKGGCNRVVSEMLGRGLIVEAEIEGAVPGPFPEGNVYHFWLRIKDGRVVDPTRWCYTNEEPYIYTGFGDGVAYEPQPRDWTSSSVRVFLDRATYNSRGGG